MNRVPPVGRLVDSLDDLGILGNSAATMQTTEFMAARIDKFGTPEAYNHYAVGWAHAMDTPYQWTKQVASHWAARATARSSTGPTASRRAAKSATSSTT